MSKIGFPEAMQIAVCIYGNRRLLHKGKGDNWFFSGHQGLSLPASVSLQIHPLDAVFLCHRVGRGPHAHFDEVPFSLHSGKVLFRKRPCLPGSHIPHRLAAAHQGNASVPDQSNNIAAIPADIKSGLTHVAFLLLRYSDPLPAGSCAKGPSFFRAAVCVIFYQNIPPMELSSFSRDIDISPPFCYTEPINLKR